jgi:hypothetical protein
MAIQMTGVLNRKRSPGVANEQRKTVALAPKHPLSITGLFVTYPRTIVKSAYFCSVLQKFVRLF